MQPADGIVGRHDELAVLEAAFSDRAAAVVVAAAGMGKTSLARTFAARRDGTKWVGATRSAAAVPLGAMAPMLGALGGARSRQDLLRRASDAIAADHHGRKFALVVDDAHLLDDASAALTLQLVRDGVCFVVATVRAGEPCPDAVVALWKDENGERVQLGPLPEAAIADLAAALLEGPVERATALRVHGATGGNPLFSRELLVAGHDAGWLRPVGGVWTWTRRFEPGGRLVELIETRLAGISADARRLLEILALAEPLEVSVVERIAAAAAVAEADEHGLLAAHDDGTVATIHPLFGDVLRSGISPLRSRALFGALVDAVDLSDGSPTVLLRQATWFLGSGRPVRASVLLATARAATGLFDYALAERLATAALDTAVDRDEEVEAMLLRADAAYWQERFAEAERWAGMVGRDVSDGHRARSSIIRASALFWGAGRYDDASAVLAGAAGDIESPDAHAELDAHRSSIDLLHGLPSLARDRAEPLLASPSPLARLRAAVVAALARALKGDIDGAAELVTDAMPLAVAHQDELPFALAQLVATQTLVLWFRAELEGLHALTTSLHDAAVRRREDDNRGQTALMLGFAELARGRLVTARAVLAESAALLELHDPGRFLAWAHALHAQAAAQLGDTQSAVDSLGRAEATMTPAGGIYGSDIQLARAWTAASAGEISRARALARLAADDSRQRGSTLSEVTCLYDATRLGDEAAAGGAPHRRRTGGRQARDAPGESRARPQRRRCPRARRNRNRVPRLWRAPVRRRSGGRGRCRACRRGPAGQPARSRGPGSALAGRDRWCPHASGGTPRRLARHRPALRPRAGDRGVGGERPQPHGDRREALRLPAHRGQPPVPDLRQARRQHARGTGEAVPAELSHV